MSIRMGVGDGSVGGNLGEWRSAEADSFPFASLRVRNDKRKDVGGPTHRDEAAMNGARRVGEWFTGGVRT